VLGSFEYANRVKTGFFLLFYCLLFRIALYDRKHGEAHVRDRVKTSNQTQGFLLELRSFEAGSCSEGSSRRQSPAFGSLFGNRTSEKPNFAKSLIRIG
jgi:hypothetical protein